MIDLNEVGSSTLLVQRRDDSSDGDKVIVLHVEVKVARRRSAAVWWWLWRSTVDNYSTMMIDNRTDLPITVMQDIRQKYKVLFEKNRNYKNPFRCAWRLCPACPSGGPTRRWKAS